MIQCKSCSKEISFDANTCSNCGAKNKKIFYKNGQFIAIAIFLFFGIIGSNSDDSNTVDADTTVVQQQTDVDSVTKNTIKEEPCPVEVVSFSLERDSIDQQLAKVQFKNISDKVIKNIKFNVFAYDLNGYPVKVQFDYEDYLSCSLERTLQPGESSDPEIGWNIYNQGTEVNDLRVVVKDVEFFNDVPTQNNSKYNEEIKQFLGKPIDNK